MATDFNELLKFIAQDANTDQIKQIVNAVNFRRDILNRQNKFMFKVGQKVCFTKRDGVVETGMVQKVAIKKAQVKVSNTLWTVPFNMLKAA